MAAISIGDALSEGFGLIGRRPLAVLAWGLVRTVFSGATVALMTPFYMLTLNRLTNIGKAGARPAPADLAAMMQLQGLSYLLSFAGLFVGVMLSCAIFRAVLHPEQNRFAYLRLGIAELFLFLLLFAAQIVLIIGAIMAAIPIALLTAVVFAAHAPAVAIGVAVVAGVAAVALLIWVSCRLSLIGPMTVDDGKFHLFDTWRLTRGHAGALFLIALCLFVIVLLIEAVIGAIVVALGLGFVSQMPGGLRNLPALFHHTPAEILASLTPALVIMGVGSIPVSGALLAIFSAPWARAYRNLAPPDVSATFA